MGVLLAEEDGGLACGKVLAHEASLICALVVVVEHSARALGSGQEGRIAVSWQNDANGGAGVGWVEVQARLPVEERSGSDRHRCAIQRGVSAGKNGEVEMREKGGG